MMIDPITGRMGYKPTGEYPSFRVDAWRFHFNFLKPKDCIGGLVYFGWWAICVSSEGEHPRELSSEQVRIKRSMGLIEY